MRAAWLKRPGAVIVKQVPDPVLEDPRDVIVEIRYAGICGSDLWPYRGLVGKGGGSSTGHEFIGVVAETGDEVAILKPGELVIAPFMYSDGSCDVCFQGLQPLCEEAGLWGRDGAGAQAEKIRVPFADATLVRLPWELEELNTDLAKKLIPATDVFATGTHGAELAEVASGDFVVVIGDGAVGISAAVAAGNSGADRVLLLGENPGRLEIAQSFQIETLRTSRDISPVDAVFELTGGTLPDKVIECVGLEASFDAALELVKLGGRVSFVGVPHGVPDLPPHRIFAKQITLVGGVAPARHYLPKFIEQIKNEELDLSALIDAEYGLSDVAQAYESMDAGRALKVMLDIRR